MVCTGNITTPSYHPDFPIFWIGAILVAHSNILSKKPAKMTETLTHGYSSESTLRDLSNEYQHDGV